MTEGDSSRELLEICLVPQLRSHTLECLRVFHRLKQVTQPSQKSTGSRCILCLLEALQSHMTKGVDEYFYYIGGGRLGNYDEGNGLIERC